MIVKGCGWVAWAGLAVLLAVPSLQGQDIRISKPGDNKVTLSVGRLTPQGGEASRQFVETLKRNLQLSGWFRLTSDADGVLELAGPVQADDAGFEGRLTVVHNGEGRNYLRETYRGAPTDARRLAQEAADAIVWAVKRKPGIATSRLAAVGSIRGRQDIFISDADGQGLVQLTRDGAPTFSPRWGGGAARLYFTSLRSRFPDIYRVSMRDNRRTRMVQFPGLNSGANESPDGRTLALTLSRDGNTELYTMDLGSGVLTRLTRTRQAAEASPSWSPDGSQIVFVSDRTGRPQLYIVSRGGGNERRLTLEGRENVSPCWGPDGRIAFSSLREGRYHIVTYDPKTGSQEQWTRGGADSKDPAWAPDGRHIAYSRTSSYQSSIYVLDTMGDPEIRLFELQGDWYSPAWSSAAKRP